jgi:hypothetical protein
MRWDKSASVTSEPKPILRPTGKLVLQSAGIARIGVGETIFASVVRQGTAGGPSGFFQLQVSKGGEEVGAGYIINAQNLYTPQAGIYGLDLMSDGRRLRVNVSRQLPTQYGRMLQPVMTTVVRDLRQLVRENPEDVRVFIAPALLELTGIDCFPPQPGDVYRAFASLPPDPTVADHLRKLLPSLDSDDFASRTRATADLAELGGSGVLAALRLDRRRLSATQQAAVDGFVAAHTLDPTRPADEAMRDASFLIQCVAYPDPTVRDAAAAALGALAGREVRLDAGHSPDVLRRDLLDVIYPGAKIDPDPPRPDPETAYGIQGMDDALQRDQIRRMRLLEPQMLAGYRKEKEYALRDLMEVRRVKGLPVVKWGKKLQVGNPTRVGVKDAPGDWIVYRAGDFRNGAGGGEAMFVWSDARRDGDQGPWKINVNFSDRYLAINAQYGENATITSVSMNIVNGGIIFSAGRDARGRPLIQGQGDSLADLTKQNPRAVRQYVAPILHDVFGLYFAAPEPGLAYEVFHDLPIDEQARRQLDDLLPDLDASSPAVRMAAAQSLEELGLPGIVAATQRDRADLTFEQRARLGAFLASHGAHGDPEEAKRLRKDTSFLLACLEFEDVQVRKAAKAALESVTARPIDLDVNLASDDLATAVEAVRTKLEAQER